MQRFFFDDEQICDGIFYVEGEKYNHIIRSLRISVHEKVIFCDGNFTDFECELLSSDAKRAEFKIITKYRNQTEPQVKITVFQCLPKGEKMDEMVKRSVQFGAYEIIPVLSSRCVSRPDRKASAKKVERFNKIARSSAMQSMRGYIPKVSDVVDFKTSINMLSDYETAFICYENEEKTSVGNIALSKNNIAFLVGPEGGLDLQEIEYAGERGIKSVSLGKRILRTEDAACFLIPILLSNTDNL